MLKKISLTVLAVVVIAFAALAIKGNKMSEVSTEIEIAAPPEQVWQVVTDINRWHEWSSVINKSSGEASNGATLDITMMSETEGKDGPRYQPVITNFDEARNISWRATMGPGFVFTNQKIIDIEATESGSRLIHKETFSGMLAALMGAKMEKGVPPILNSFNEDLKKQLEQ